MKDWARRSVLVVPPISIDGLDPMSVFFASASCGAGLQRSWHRLVFRLAELSRFQELIAAFAAHIVAAIFPPPLAETSTCFSFFSWGVVLVSYILEAKFTNKCMHVPRILRNAHIQILWNGAAAYPTPKLKINWENVKIQEFPEKEMAMYRNNTSSQDNSHTLSEILQKLSYFNIIDSKPVAENCWLHIMQK